MDYGIRDVDVLARTIFGEARGEDWIGKLAVGWVIRNRTEVGGWWTDGTIEGTARHPWQFSAWNKSDPNRSRMESVTDADSRFRECVRAACNVLTAARTDDPTYGSTHYHTTAISPKWAQGKTPVVTLGAHAFYKDIA